MDEQLDRDDAQAANSPIYHAELGTPSFVVVFICILLVLSVTGNLYQYSSVSKVVPLDNVQAAQINAQTKEIEFQLESHRQDQALRMDIAKKCYEAGNIPVILNGNVDCRIGPKK